jgi:hypothetical protein
MASSAAPTAKEVESVGLNFKASLLLDLTQELGRKNHFKINNLSGVKAGQVAVGISAIAIETTTGPIQALNYPSRLERFKILIN